MINYFINAFPRTTDLDSLWLSAWGHAGPSNYIKVLSRSLAHICAYDGERLVGFVNVAWDGGIHAFVLDTCVHRSWQRKGIGTGLIGKAVEVARDRNIVWLHVDYEKHLSSFYHRCGFSTTQAALLRL